MNLRINKGNEDYLKKIQTGIMIAVTALTLSGCTKQGQEIEEPNAVMEIIPVEKPDEAAADGREEIERTEEIKEIEETEELLAESDNSNMPEIEVTVSGSSSFLDVKIHNEKEYQAFVDCLEEYTESVGLTLFLEETDTVIYLDDILAYQNFRFLDIHNGGTISVRNMEILHESPVIDIELYHIYAIEENILSQMFNLQYITIRVDSQYNGALPAKELLQNTDCTRIVVRWDDEGKEEVNMEEFDEWDEINAMLSEDNCYLKALYVSNEDEYNYISYEFRIRGEEKGNTCEANECAAFICIKDRESYGEKYFDIVEVPVESINTLAWLDGRRVRLEDVNFDGYRDLIFVGYNDPIGTFDGCIGFLWNEKAQRYEWNATVPKNCGRIDDERKRITNVYTSSLEDDYFIYEYHDGIFTEKKMEVIGSLTDYYQCIWQYYESGELLKRLEQNFNEETKQYYITYEENGIVTEEVMEEADYDNKYSIYHDLGKEYFPEFDFYWAG
ncbi:MAG: hypothetical protein NC231_01210 [Bacillus sp. (in: Bacteria)]|nr:hypothetical protein [Bacillus sp. (in: firmicutes)]MCM1426401.1 hypothetical protein [Eubacterium sp.]